MQAQGTANNKYNHIKANFILKNIAGIIDATIILGICTLYQVILQLILTPQLLNILEVLIPNIGNMLVMLLLYRLVFVFCFNATIGMLLMRICYLSIPDNDAPNVLTDKEKLCASLLVYINAVDMYTIGTSNASKN